MRRYIILVTLVILMSCGEETTNLPDTITETKDFLGDAVDSEESEESLQEVLDEDSPEEIQEEGKEIQKQDAKEDACAPNCENKECGDDGCGGKCGECEEGDCLNGICCMPKIIGYYNISVGYARDVFVINNLALVADSGTSGLMIIDVSNPKSPFQKAYYPTGETPWAVAASTSNIVYLAVDKQGLLILDVTDPVSPQLKGSYNTLNAWNVFVGRDRVYFIDFATGLYILDVADPTNPFLLGEWPSVNRRDVYVNGTTAYLVGDQPIDAPETGFQILDVSDPTHPYLKGILLSVDGSAVFATKNFAFIARSNQGLKTFDISDPANPFIKGSFPLINIAEGFFFSEEEKLGYLSAGFAGLLIIDLKDFANPVLKYQVNTEGVSQNLFVEGSLAYVADGLEGLRIIETCKCLPSCIGKQEGENDGCGGACL